MPKEYVPGVEKGIKSVMDSGPLAGFPVIDFKVALIDGKFHDVDSSVLAALLPKSVRNRVFNAIAEAATSEHGARMTSMGSATDNAGKMIDSLTLFRNRARQAAITQEISEIVGGANALA